MQTFRVWLLFTGCDDSQGFCGSLGTRLYELNCAHSSEVVWGEREQDTLSRRFLLAFVDELL